MYSARVGRLTQSSYIGRFAPSPSGALHFGSLITALGSYLQAKSQQGKWLVRIEDIDPPREVTGAATDILKTLEIYHLFWDGDVLYQHTRLKQYQQQIDHWLAQNKAYYCQCRRKDIKAMGGIYTGKCRHLNLSPQDAAMRIHLSTPTNTFMDKRLGLIHTPNALAQEDFIIKRRDHLFAYNLAVVLDDIYQGVTEVVRGTDLLSITCQQIGLYKELGATPISYLHLPLALQEQGLKYSKQNHAPALSKNAVIPTLVKALGFLGIETCCQNFSQVDDLLTWAVSVWDIKKLPNSSKIVC